MYILHEELAEQWGDTKLFEGVLQKGRESERQEEGNQGTNGCRKRVEGKRERER